jgi:hypothetical protein
MVVVLGFIYYFTVPSMFLSKVIETKEENNKVEEVRKELFILAHAFLS